MSWTFLPSAVYYGSHGGLAIYVKYGPTGLNTIEVHEESTSHVWVKTPDRELLLTGNDHTDSSIRPLDCNFDECITLSNFHDTARDFNINGIMLNYPQSVAKAGGSPEFRKQRQVLPNTTVYSDSGGFQMLMGRIKFIDPVKLAQWYNDNADLGMILDLPYSHVDQDLFERSAKLQKQNTNLMLEHTSPSKLINILHGRSIKMLKAHHDLVYDDRIKRICMGAAYIGNPINCFGDLVSIADALDYPHYHILGVYNVGITPLYIRYANSNLMQGKLLTSDASTHVLSAMNQLYHFQQSADSPPERWAIGLTGKVKYPNQYKLLPCSCPVCRAIKYVDIFNVLSKAILNYILMQHNLFEITRYMKMMDEYAKELDDQNYTELLKGQTRNNKSRQMGLVKGMQFLDTVLAQGVQKARSRFHFFFEENRLFNTAQADFSNEMLLGLGEAPAEADFDYAAHLDSVIKLYEQYHNGHKIEVRKSKDEKRATKHKKGGTSHFNKFKTVGKQALRQKSARMQKKATKKLKVTEKDQMAIKVR